MHRAYTLQQPGMARLAGNGDAIYEAVKELANIMQMKKQMWNMFVSSLGTATERVAALIRHDMQHPGTDTQYPDFGTTRTTLMQTRTTRILTCTSRILAQNALPKYKLALPVYWDGRHFPGTDTIYTMRLYIYIYYISRLSPLKRTKTLYRFNEQ